MSALRPQPRIFEINTWAWLHELSAARGEPVTLATVASGTWDDVAAVGADVIWLMGVWERSPAGAGVARHEQWRVEDGRAYLPDFTLDDVVGSPYCIRRYVPDGHLGGWDGLAAARAELRARGMGLILDFVPNHVAPDHPWVTEHPHYLIRGTEADLLERPGEFVPAGGAIVALGRDPYFPPWPDVLQLNAFDEELRHASVEILTTIGEHCDGVRCDMAMLVMNDIFSHTWGRWAGDPPAAEYWPAVIPRVKEHCPDMVFLAEAYWDREWALMQQGFDYCYDKRLYDRLQQGDPHNVRLHLQAGIDYQMRLVRFIENHDEPRASAVFSPGALRAAAVVISTLPGAILYHQGQFEGRKLRAPVALGRWPAEGEDAALAQFYRRLVEVSGTLRQGQWRLCAVEGWPDNDSARNIVSWCWSTGDASSVVAVNLAPTPSQGRVRLLAEAVGRDVVVFTDALSGDVFERKRDDLLADGLYVGLDGFGVHILQDS